MDNRGRRREPSKRRRKQNEETRYEYNSENRAKSSPSQTDRRRKQASMSEEQRIKRRQAGEKRARRRRGRLTKEQRANIKSRRIGIALSIVQIIASVLFSAAIIQLDMLPVRYVVILFVLLVVLGALLLLGQIYSKKNAIIGKVLTGILAIVLFIGSFYIFKISGTLSDISGGSVKVDHMVVAVLDDDPAESIEDVADYVFGVQYSMDEDDVADTIDAIEEELGTTINVVEYSDMQEIAVALQNGEVGAIIYNEAHEAFIEDENPDFSSDVRYVYTHEITTQLSLGTVETSNISVDDECFIVYISGIDVYGEITKNSRSDVNMLAVVNPNTYEILLVNTPRDYYVEFPDVTGSSKDKLTHAGIYGVDVSMATLEQLYDIEIDFYARVNFTSLIEMVDALGGISVYSEYTFTTSANSGSIVYVQEGYNDFDGTEALSFARERYNVPGGDNQRGINQQEVIKAMIEKVTSPAIITGANALLASVSGNVDTNMSDDQIQELIKMQISENIDWNIDTVSATGTGGNAYCYSYAGGTLYVTYPDYDVVDEISEQIQTVLAGGSLDEIESETEEATETAVQIEIE